MSKRVRSSSKTVVKKTLKPTQPKTAAKISPKASSKGSNKASKVVKEPSKEVISKQPSKTQRESLKKPEKKNLEAKVKSTEVKRVEKKSPKLPSKESKQPNISDKQEKSKVKELKSKLERDLLNEKANLEKRISSIQFRPSESTGDFGDISSALSDEGLLLIERDRLIGQLEKVKQVLNRLTTNKYFANCDDCGDEIEYKRLIFIPTARRCVHCQQNVERK